ncbi:MAG TPA: hypothetical protein VGO37_18245 [Steroidobacteraceae bacterium]|jgi:hypothetical protein|nr:hypothetical protein [Steroidobacteraceae bacterium]
MSEITDQSCGEGYAKDEGIDHNLELFVINVSDERGQIFRYSNCGSCSSVANYAVQT